MFGGAVGDCGEGGHGARNVHRAAEGGVETGGAVYWTSYGRLVIIRCFAFFFLFFSAATIPKLSPDGYARNLARIRPSVQGSLSF